MKRAFLIAMAALLMIEAFFPEAAEAKKKKKKKGAPAVEEVVTETEAEDVLGEQAPEGETATKESAEPKSIGERLADDGSESTLRSSRRMEFDERLVKGQAAKSGAVYLFKRIPRRLPGLVPLRRSYRRRIVEPVLGTAELKPARYSYEVEKEQKAKEREETLSEIKEVEAEAVEEVVEGEKETAKETSKNGVKTLKNKNDKAAKGKKTEDTEDLVEEIE